MLIVTDLRECGIPSFPHAARAAGPQGETGARHHDHRGPAQGKTSSHLYSHH